MSYSRLDPYQEYSRPQLRASDFHERDEAFHRATRRLLEKLWALHEQLPADATVSRLYSDACVTLEKLVERLEENL